MSVSGGAGALVLETAISRLTFRRIAPSLSVALQHLAQHGEYEDRLQERVLQEGGVEALAKLSYYLERLDRHGLLLRSVCSGDTTLMTLVPTSRYFRLASQPIEPDHRYVLCRFSYTRREGHEMILESPLAHAQIRLYSARAMAILHTLAQPGRLSELSKRASDLSVDVLVLLLGAGLVRHVGDEAPSLRAWEFHDLLFHARSRMGRHDYQVGGTFPFAGEIPPPPALKSVHSQMWIDLYRPYIDVLQHEDQPLLQVQEMHRTVRDYGSRPIDLSQLGEFLYRTARVRYHTQAEVRTPRGPVQVDFALRPYPGGGALYELELYPIVNICNGLGSGLYYYDALNHRLGYLSGRKAIVEQLLADAAWTAEVPRDRLQVLLVVAARFQRRAWKYASIAYSTMLKNVGVLYQTMYLVATVMGLCPCAVPGGNSDLFASAAGTDYYAETSVGEFLLGSKL
jgi:SagB-type dehydrogenase family enzyme